MPTYELECTACRTRFERFLTRVLREEDKVCPACGSTDVKQGIGGGYVSRRSPSAPQTGCVPRGGFG